MAIPTTQKECTTRRIAALIIGLWAKVKDTFLLKTSRGTANGVASLDKNGKVPSSQLPTVPTGNLPSNSSSSAGIVASGNGQNTKSWMTDVNGNPAWRDIQNIKSIVIGKDPDNTDDLNNITAPNGGIEFYKIKNKSYVSNIPITDEGSVLVLSYGGGVVWQFFIAKSTKSVYVRIRISGTWSTWDNTRDASWVDSYTKSEIDGKLNGKLDKSPSYIGATSIDLNSLTSGGSHDLEHYVITNKSNVSNKPVDDVGLLYVLSYSGGYVTQVYVTKNSLGMYIRARYSSSWTGWAKVSTNIVIEHVNTIPVNPTVGTIYAL